jgi:hypothetical protein
LLIDVPNDIDRELERELHRWLDPMVAAPIPPRTVPARGAFGVKLLAGAGAALGAKLVVGVAIAAMAGGLAGVAAEAVITGSLNPVEWSQQARHQVVTLGSQLGATVSEHNAVSSPAAHLAGASNGSGQQPVSGQPATGQPVSGQPAQPAPQSPQPNSVAVPPAEPTTSAKPSPPGCGPTSPETAGGC